MSITHTFFTAVTDIGDSACLVTMAAAGSIYLVSRSARRAAVFLCAALFISALLIGLCKIYFLSCHTHFHSLNIHSPSGHTALSAGVFWAIAILMRSQLEPSRRFLPLLLLTLLIAVIAYSRVYLEYHNAAEIVIGAVAGYLALQLARFFVLRGKSSGPFDAYALALWCVVAAFCAHGYHLPMEEVIHTIAAHMHGHGAMCSSS